MTKPFTSTTNPSALHDQLASIESQLIRQNSLVLSFVRGLLTGLGASVGVTVVLGIVVYILTQIARALGIEAMVLSVIQPLMGT